MNVPSINVWYDPGSLWCSFSAWARLYFPALRRGMWKAGQLQKLLFLFYSLLSLHQSHHHQQASHQDNEDDVSPPCWCWVVHSSLSNTQVSCTHSISITLFGRELSCPLIRHWIWVQWILTLSSWNTQIHLPTSLFTNESYTLHLHTVGHAFERYTVFNTIILCK